MPRLVVRRHDHRDAIDRAHFANPSQRGSRWPNRGRVRLDARQRPESWAASKVDHGETFLLTAIGVIPGLLVGYFAEVAFTMSFSSDQFPITAEVEPLRLVGAVLVMFVVSSLSPIPAIRAVRWVNVGEIVPERAA